MNNLYNKLYYAINEGIQKALLVDPEQNDVSVNYSYHKIDNQLDPLLIKFIDLDLPSGTLWCEHNLGATCGKTAESWYGDYYAWGEIIPNKDEYTWKTYRSDFCNQPDDENDLELYKYYTPVIENPVHPEPTYSYGHKLDNKLNLRLTDDIAHKRYSKIKNSEMAKIVKMPTNEQCEELIKWTSHEWVENYQNIIGLTGMIFTGRNDNFIFIPASGTYAEQENEWQGKYGNLWTNSLYTDHSDNAWMLNFNNYGALSTCDSLRCFGAPIRGVVI